MYKQFAYRVFRTLTAPVSAGTITALDMEDAIKRIIARNGIEVKHEINRSLGQDSYFVLNGQKVGILVYARPEDF